MLREVVEYLRPREGGLYVDATVGLGGHSLELLGHIGTRGRLICMDRDGEALNIARQRLPESRCIFRQAKFSGIADVVEQTGLGAADGVLFDFGVSMMQLKDPLRGFGFDSEELLDMRMDKSSGITASDIVNEWPEAEIARVLFEYGEERASRKIARAIVNRRMKSAFKTCRELSAFIAGVMGGKRSAMHPATRSFQGLRIAVNDELNEIERGLGSALSCMKPGGRLVAISYHSLEDRIVKRFMRRMKTEGKLDILTKKPLTASDDELRLNPSARSAKLRAGEAV